MMNNRETVADIVAQMRGRGEDGRMDMSLWRDYADRIEAAMKREREEVEAARMSTAEKSSAVGNAAAMLEALEYIGHYCDSEYNMDDPYCADGHILAEKARSALSVQPRNCDVGTADEQENRYDAFVRARRGDLSCRGGCPAHNGVDYGIVNCVLRWSQMPYEAQEGGAK